MEDYGVHCMNITLCRLCVSICSGAQGRPFVQACRDDEGRPQCAVDPTRTVQTSTPRGAWPADAWPRPTSVLDPIAAVHVDGDVLSTVFGFHLRPDTGRVARACALSWLSGYTRMLPPAEVQAQGALRDEVTYHRMAVRGPSTLSSASDSRRSVRRRVRAVTGGCRGSCALERGFGRTLASSEWRYPAGVGRPRGLLSLGARGRRALEFDGVPRRKARSSLGGGCGTVARPGDRCCGRARP